MSGIDRRAGIPFGRACVKSCAFRVFSSRVTRISSCKERCVEREVYVGGMVWSEVRRMLNEGMRSVLVD